MTAAFGITLEVPGSIAVAFTITILPEGVARAMELARRTRARSEKAFI